METLDIMETEVINLGKTWVMFYNYCCEKTHIRLLFTLGSASNGVGDSYRIYIANEAELNRAV